MESLGAVGMGTYANGPAVAQRELSLDARDSRRIQPGGYRPPGTAPVPLNSPSEFVGFDAYTRHNITQIFFGCQSVMIYAAEGHVELLLSMDPSNSWQPLAPDAAEELGQRLLDAAHVARNRGDVARADEQAKMAIKAQRYEAERRLP